MNRKHWLDVYRTVAIIWVLLFHARVLGLGSPCPGVASWGWIGVDLFFVLSGYLIGGQLLRNSKGGDAIAFGNFYIQRALRILPVYSVVLAVYFFWPSLRETGLIQPFWQFASFTENILIDYSRDRAFSHVWSLCVEEHFYLLFPICLWVASRRPSFLRTCLGFTGLMVLGLVLRASIFELQLTDLRSETHYKYFESIYYPSYTRLDGLLVGVIIACVEYFYSRFWLRLLRSLYVTIPCALISSYLSYFLFSSRFGFVATVLGYPMLSISLGFWLILACALNSMDFVVRIPGAGFIARLAFTLYLSHKIVLVWIKEHLISRLPNSDFLVFIVYAASILLVAAVLHFMVERPVLNWRDRHFKEPNQALLPTTMSVTPRACARVAPDTVAADL